MATLAAPLHTGTINGKPLRFFRAPFDEPQMPWHAPHDLHDCLGMPAALMEHFQRMLQSPEWSSDVRTIATVDGIVTIAPHWMAAARIQSVIEFGRAHQSFQSEFEREAGLALGKVAVGWSEEDFVEQWTSAFCNSSGIVFGGGSA